MASSRTKASNRYNRITFQVLVNKLLTTWGYEKFFKHVEFVRSFYRGRRDLTLAAMERHLTGLAEWTVPTAGMFMWIKIHGIPDVYEMLINRGLKKNIIFTPGHAFMVDQNEPCNLVRVSYSKTHMDDIDEAMRLLAELIREEHELMHQKVEERT